MRTARTDHHQRGERPGLFRGGSAFFAPCPITAHAASVPHRRAVLMSRYEWHAGVTSRYFFRDAKLLYYIHPPTPTADGLN